MLLGRAEICPFPTADMGCDDSRGSGAEEAMDTLSDTCVDRQKRQAGEPAGSQPKPEDSRTCGRQTGVSVCLAELGSHGVARIMPQCWA